MLTEKEIEEEYSMVVKDEDSSIMTATCINAVDIASTLAPSPPLCCYCYCSLMLNRLHIPMCKVFKTTKLCS